MREPPAIISGPQAPAVVSQGPSAHPRLTLLGRGAGAFFATIIICGFGGLLALFGSEVARQSIRDACVVGVLGLALLVLDVPYLLRLWLEIRRRNPDAPLAVALTCRRAPLVVRPLVALWWLAHFVSGCAMATSMARDLSVQHGSQALSDRIGGIVVASMISLAATAAANGFLAMTVAAISTRPEVLRRVWRFRALVAQRASFDDARSCLRNGML